MKLIFYVAGILTALLVASMQLSCMPRASVSDTEGFGPGYSKRPQANAIACSLIKAGFQNLRRPGGRSAKEYTSDFFANRDMIDLFTCIADAESTLGTDHRTNSGGYRGVLQVAHMHARNGEFAACTGKDLKNLDNNTRCAAAIYKKQGLGAWEVIALGRCKAPVVEKMHCNDSSLEALRPGSCGAGFKYDFSADGMRLSVSIASGCHANQATAILLKAVNGRSVLQAAPRNAAFTANGDNRTAIFDLSAIRRPEHTHVRILLKRDDQELYRTNPAPALPTMSADSGTATAVGEPAAGEPDEPTEAQPSLPPPAPAPVPNPPPVSEGKAGGCEIYRAISECVFAPAPQSCEWQGDLFVGKCVAR